MMNYLNIRGVVMADKPAIIPIEQEAEEPKLEQFRGLLRYER
jgi:hypothetical protein